MQLEQALKLTNDPPTQLAVSALIHLQIAMWFVFTLLLQGRRKPNVRESPQNTIDAVKIKSFWDVKFEEALTPKRNGGRKQERSRMQFTQTYTVA